MLGHLKAEEFINLMDCTEMPAKQKEHLDRCDQCRETWDSTRRVRHEVASAMETDIPEPDWHEFRSSVRDQLLSRSIQRQTSVRRWTGWTFRPSLAWALSMFLVVGLTAVTLLWRGDNHVAPPATIVESAASETAPAASSDIAPDRTLFDDLMQLGDEEQEQLRQMLASEQQDNSYR